MAKDLLLEIGTEEIPAKFMKGALEQMGELADKFLGEARLEHGDIRVYGTPRRLTLHVLQVSEDQPDLEVEAKGPSVKAAFDSEGKATKAAEGFARGQGVDVSQLVRKETPQGEYVFATKKTKGEPASVVLPGILQKIIFGLSFPKPMRWAYYEMRFARPIRSLVSLYGEEVLALAVEGVAAGRETSGHRFLSKGKVAIPSPAAYLETLKKHYVIADPVERKALVWKQITELAAAEGGSVDEDEDLLEEITQLLEYPTALCGTFAESFLEVPEEVVITPMKEHQRYFPVRGKDGKLLAKFITVRNGSAEHLEIVRAGNEKVLRARLSDAHFFYQEDRKAPLEKQVDKLKKIVFHEQLGTVYQKVERIMAISEFLAQRVPGGQEILADVQRAAYLSKADLVTSMVYEFPELQGIMGADYARHSGEKETVAQAIREHYQPRFAGDALPPSLVGALVSMADKLDSIIGAFAIGIQPTGSQDPYALRRQALGVTHILLERKLDLSLQEVIAFAYSLLGTMPTVAKEKVLADVTDFFQQRVRNILLEGGLRYDTVDAALAVGTDNLADARKRAMALQDFRSAANFEALLNAYNRAANLAKKDEGGAIDETALQAPAEQGLLAAYSQAEAAVARQREAGDYLAALETIAGLQPAIDRFFEEIMVMVEDQKVRQSRLALLKAIAALAAPIADLSKVVTP